MWEGLCLWSGIPRHWPLPSRSLFYKQRVQLKAASGCWAMSILVDILVFQMSVTRGRSVSLVASGDLPPRSLHSKSNAPPGCRSQPRSLCDVLCTRSGQQPRPSISPVVRMNSRRESQGHDHVCVTWNVVMITPLSSQKEKKSIDSATRAQTGVQVPAIAVSKLT